MLSRLDISLSIRAATSAVTRRMNATFASTCCRGGSIDPTPRIKRSDVIELVERLVAEDKNTLANWVQALVSSIFSFAVDADLIEHNPCARLRKRGVENVGRRVLSDAEIKLLWSSAAEPPRARQLLLGLRLALSRAPASAR